MVSRVHAPAGFVTGVQAYRLFVREEGLYVIHLGRGWMGPQRAPGGGVISNWLGQKIANWLRERIDAKLAVVDREIFGVSPEELLERKRSSFVPAAKQGAVTCAIEPHSDPSLTIRSGRKKLQLFGREQEELAFAQIAHFFEGRSRV